MKKTFKYRIEANNNTIQSAEKAVDLCRILYNLCLEQRIFAWRHYRKSVSEYERMKQTVDLKKVFPEFSNVPSQTLQDIADRLNKAYENFFRRVKAGETPGFPRFKGYDRYNSFTLKQAS